VLIPGVNDEHLKEVSKVVKAKGAFLHNVMPLIAEAEHGTFYGLMGQRSPTPAELKDLQDACEGDMNMMRHCRQCRADAVGLLGEDRGAEFTLDKIADMNIDEAFLANAKQVRDEARAKINSALEEQKRRAEAPAQPAVVTFHRRTTAAAEGRPVLMAVATKGSGVINEHFGHAREFLIYEATAAGAKLVGHRKTELYCSGDDTCGEEEDVLAKIIRALEGCETVLCAKIGFEPWGRLEAAGIVPNGEHAMEPVEEAVMAVWREMLTAGKLAAPTAVTEKRCA
jgi:nitrogen fixation protein NifB